MGPASWSTWRSLTLGLLVVLVGCDGGDGGAQAVDATATIDAVAADPGATDPGAPPVEDLDMSAEDFECLQGWTKVRRFYLTNKLGHLDEAIAVAESPDGGTYPVGTIIQLVPFEAMVKRAPGFSAESNDWEFFSLDVDSGATVILERGTAGVVNQFGGECLPCHAMAEPKWDFVCEQDHGCDPIPLSDFVVESLQEGDPRCP